MAAGAALPLFAAPSISILITRPDGPLPSSDPASIPRSAAILFATPEMRVGESVATFAAALLGSFAAGVTTTAAAFALFAATAPAGRAAASSIFATSVPTFCSVPDFTTNRIAPDAGESNSRVALSESISFRSSSFSTQSPSLLRHVPRVTSVMDSPGLGTTTSTMCVTSHNHCVSSIFCLPRACAHLLIYFLSPCHFDSHLHWEGDLTWQKLPRFLFSPLP